MTLTIAFSSDEILALRRLAEHYNCDPERAARMALRDWLIGHGYMDLFQGRDEETEMQEKA